MNPIVYIVHHIDTEGPLYESVSETFLRIEDILNEKIDIEPTKENLIKLQKGEIKTFDDEKRELIKKILHPHLLEYKKSWAEVDEMMYRILLDSYRQKFKDSFGNGWVYNWHIMDHTGFTLNPRHRIMGYLNVFDHYLDLLKETNSLPKDEVHWHFHPVHLRKQANICATSYENSYYEIHQIICRRIIERNWFPIVNRAGFHTERPDSNWFLEQWMPFDASNQCIDPDDYSGNGRFGDWKGAPSDWEIYHPDIYDWRKKGSLKRAISRVLNLKTRFRNINKSEINKAFKKANEEKCNVYMGITDHDFREISIEIEDFYKDLLTVKKSYPNVEFKFSGAVEAFRAVLQSDLTEPNIEFAYKIEKNVLILNVIKGEIFGPQPYLAIKLKSGEYFHDNFDFGEFKREYYYTFDIHTIPMEQIDVIKIATNNSIGNQTIQEIKL
jgi:hypothetical protein